MVGPLCLYRATRFQFEVLQTHQRGPVGTMFISLQGLVTPLRTAGLDVQSSVGERKHNARVASGGEILFIAMSSCQPSAIKCLSEEGSAG
jgi:hypothetical protein